MRTVYACSLTFSLPIDAVWSEVSAWITGWYGSKHPDVQLPAGWDTDNAIHLTPAQRHSLEVSCSSSAASSEQLREVRWRYPDQYDPSLIWASDISVHEGGGEVSFTLALRLASFEFELLPARFELGTPRIVRTLVALGSARVGSQALLPQFWRVEALDVPKLKALLLDRQRRLPVVVMSPDAFTERLSADPAKLASTLAGTATVAVLASKWAAFALTDELGRQFSCFNGAVRIYWPRFTLSADPLLHRLWLAEQITRLAPGQNFALELLRVVAPAAAFRFVEPEKMRAYRRRAEQERLEALKSQLSEDYTEVYRHWDDEIKKNKELRAHIEALTTENATLRENMNAVWTVAPKTEESVSSEAFDRGSPDVASVEAAVDEAQRRTTHLHFLPDALKSAKDSPFKQPQKALSALLAIDEVARAWLLSLGGLREAFKTLGFDYADDISSTTRGKHGKEYTYRYEGVSTSFEPHITIGAKQPDKCLSIHMHWDAEHRRVAIAHVGRHKSNTKT